MIRRLLLVLAAVAAWWLAARLSRRAKRPEAPQARSSPRFEGAMVRDRVCQTFVPRTSAIRLSQSGEEYFFCSESCRAAFIGARRSTP